MMIPTSIDLETLMTFNLYPYYPIESRYESARFYIGFIKNKALIAVRGAPFVVRSRPSFPLVDMILYREISGGRRVQVLLYVLWLYIDGNGCKCVNIVWRN